MSTLLRSTLHGTIHGWLPGPKTACTTAGAELMVVFEGHASQITCKNCLIRLRPIPAIDRFLAKVNFDGLVVSEELGPCWLWTGHLNYYGYGHFRVTSKLIQYAHRFAWEALSGGSIPEDLPELDHLCRTRSCVNVDHLEPVTHRENLNRMGVAEEDEDEQTFDRSTVVGAS